MTTATLDPVEKARLTLRDAVASGKNVERAAKRLEAAREAEAKRIARAKDKLDAENAAAERKRAEQRAERERRANEVEAEVRAHEPYALIHAAGKVIRVRLAHEDTNGRGVAVEAVRRIVYQAVHRYQESVVASRSAGAPVAQADWLRILSGSEAGLIYAERLGLVTVTDEEKAAQ